MNDIQKPSEPMVGDLEYSQTGLVTLVAVMTACDRTPYAKSQEFKMSHCMPSIVKIGEV